MAAPITALPLLTALPLSILGFGLLATAPAAASPYFFTTGSPDGLMATASIAAANGNMEIETADDFVLSSSTAITSATFTGLLTGGASIVDIGKVQVEIYRVFPKDSTNPPDGRVPTRTNSPSDVEFHDPELRVASVTALVGSFTARNSVVNGIHPIPNQTTGGDGPVTGEEVQVDVQFTQPFILPADHYFFIPCMDVADGEFLWLSAPRPTAAADAPFTPDFQTWIRNEELAPDWLRVGTDIVGGDSPPTFNAAFSLTGATVPEPASLTLLGIALAGFGLRRPYRGRCREGRNCRRPIHPS